jgi:hypothetical protein
VNNEWGAERGLVVKGKRGWLVSVFIFIPGGLTFSVKNCYFLKIMLIANVYLPESDFIK